MPIQYTCETRSDWLTVSLSLSLPRCRLAVDFDIRSHAAIDELKPRLMS